MAAVVDCSALLRAAAPEAASAGVVVVTGGEPDLRCCTDRRARQLDLVQFLLGSGPCVEAARGRTARANTTEIRTHWPDFALCARTLHVHSFLCAPLLLDDEVVATLDLYGDRSYAFDRIDEHRMAGLTGAATAALRRGAAPLAPPRRRRTLR
ncbi:GAF domain-containing protein [Saccharopolyspora gregorii]|uniref:GAF domain-containing protein n=1 Tax=Saccharopolyspora gregorii TaxID=33914 RepID=A0ABP6RPK1_9PSEU